MSGSLEHKKIVIAGGSGFLGVSLANYLADRGASVVILSRHAPQGERSLATFNVGRADVT